MTTSILKVIPWNASGLELEPELATSIGIPADLFTSSGEIVYGNYNTFAIDIKFKADTPGFVVQHIKKVIYDNDKKSIAEDIEYWEIFYISGNNRYVDKNDGSVYFLSENADSFKYGFKNAKHRIRNAKYMQIGISQFYPYDNSDNAVKFKNGTMLSSPRLVEIFGSSVMFNNIHTPANGLPYSPTKINVNGILMSGPELKRTVTGEWNEYNDEEVELKEEFQYLDPPEGIIKEPWSFKRFDYMEDMSDDEKIKYAEILRHYILDIKNKKRQKLFIAPDTIIDKDIANNLFQYLTTAQFGGKRQGQKKSIKKKSKKSKNKTKHVKSRKKKI